MIYIYVCLNSHKIVVYYYTMWFFSIPRASGVPLEPLQHFPLLFVVSKARKRDTERLFTMCCMCFIHYRCFICDGLLLLYASVATCP